MGLNKVDVQVLRQTDDSNDYSARERRAKGNYQTRPL